MFILPYDVIKEKQRTFTTKKYLTFTKLHASLAFSGLLQEKRGNFTGKSTNTCRTSLGRHGKRESERLQATEYEQSSETHSVSYRGDQGDSDLILVIADKQNVSHV